LARCKWLSPAESRPLASYIVYVASISIASNEARYGPSGAAMTLLTAAIGLGVALQLGCRHRSDLGGGPLHRQPLCPAIPTPPDRDPDRR
jgi:hypothetical protein